MFRANKDQPNEIRTIARLAGAYTLLDDFRQTAARYRQAIDGFRSLHDVTGEADATTRLGTVLNNRAEAMAEQQKALALAERSGDDAVQALVWLNLGPGG